MSKFNQQKYINDFKKNNYDRIEINVPKGTKEKLKLILGTQSINSFINECINKKLGGN